MLVGGGALLLHRAAADSWAESEEAAEAARRLDAPAPRWLDAPLPTATPRPAAPTRAPTALPTPSQPHPTRPALASAPATAARPVPTTGAARADAQPAAEPEGEVEASDPAGQADEPPPPDPDPTPTPEPRAPPDAVEIVDSAFTFLDPPEPGAQARIAVHLRNRSELPTGPLRLTLSPRWLSGWRVLAADPPVLDDRVLDGARRVFDFPGLDADAEGSFELHLLATDDAVDPPEIGIAQADRDPRTGEPGTGEIGMTRPETVAPRPRPGPARALEIPRLNLRAAVVPTAWEPPGWVVGQLRESANLSEGNTVLIGHLTGLAGNVFAHLDQLEPGDEVIATSRGLAYHFVVSETMILPGDDSLPIQPTDLPRLTLMTCAGDWDPIGQDYSHRLWVVAEPAEIAAATLERGEPGPLTRQRGLSQPATIVAPAEIGPPPKELVAPPDASSEAASEAAPEPAVAILAPDDGAAVGSRVVVRGRLTEAADPRQPVWLAVRAEIEGSRWYLHGGSLALRADGSWDASLELGGGPGVRHTIVVAPVDAAADADLRQQVGRRPGEPLPSLPDAFEAGARVTVVRR